MLCYSQIAIHYFHFISKGLEPDTATIAIVVPDRLSYNKLYRCDRIVACKLFPRRRHLPSGFLRFERGGIRLLRRGGKMPGIFYG